VGAGPDFAKGETMNSNHRNQSVVRRLANIVRSIPNKLWQHKVVTAIRVLVGALTFATTVFAGYYGYTSWKHQQQVVAEADLRRVEAEVLHYNDVSQRWTEAKVADVSKSRLVDFGYVRQEVTVQVTLAGDKFQHVSLAGVIGREPELQGAGLMWGKPVGRKSEAAVLLPRRFFERLGGRWDAAGRPQPQTASLVVTRVKDGVPQTQRFQMRIAGLLKRDTGKVYAPLELAIHLDRWQTHKSDSPLGDSPDSLERLLSYDWVDAYVPVGLAAKVAEEEAGFGVLAERIGEVELLCPQGEIWAAVVPQAAEKDTAILPDHSLPPELSQELWPVWQFRQEAEGRQVTYAALRENDPRWKSAPQGVAPEFGELLAIERSRASQGELLGQRGKWRRLAAPLPDVPRADVYGTERTLQWLRFESQHSAAVRKQTRIDIDSYEAAATLHKLRPGLVHSDEWLAWSMYEIETPPTPPTPPASPDAAGQPLACGEPRADSTLSASASTSTPDLPEIVERLQQQCPEGNCGIVQRGVVEVLPVAVRPPGDRGKAALACVRRLTRVRFVPAGFFDRLAGSSAWHHFHREELPCVVVSDGKNEINLATARLDGRLLRPLATIAWSQSEVWFPEDLATTVPAEATGVGFVVWSEWPHMAALNAAVEHLPTTMVARRLFDRMPRQFWITQDSPECDWKSLLKESQLDPSRVRVSPLLSLPVRLQHEGRRLAERIVAVAEATDFAEENRFVRLRHCPADVATVSIAVGGKQVELVLRQDPNVLAGDACVSMNLFERLAFECDAAKGSLPSLGRSVPMVCLPDVHALRQMQRRLGEQGLRLELTEGVPPTRLLRYAVRVKGPQGEPLPVPPTKAGELVMARPTFQAVFPRIGVTALLDGKPIQMASASGGDDPRWFEFPLLAGRPVEGGPKQGEICLPAKLAERQFPGLSPEDIVGRTVRLTLNRQDDMQRVDASVRLLLNVVAVSGSEQCLASLESVTAWRLWQEGKLVHDSATGQFRTPAEVYDQRGFISAVFYASSDRAVRPLVEHLESLGCDVQHRLDDQEGLGRLAIALATLVVLFVSGSILNASANSGAVSWMDLATKFKEIGIKMAYGVTRGDIAFAYVAEGFIVGTMACTAGTMLVVVADPLLRDLVARTIGLGADFFLLPVFALAVGWLYALAAAVVVGFNVLGTLLPTWLALRKSPVELLR